MQRLPPPGACCIIAPGTLARKAGRKMTIFSLFNLISLLYILRSVQLTAVIWREWQTLRQPPLTPRQKHLAEQASFFIAVPVGVLLHELGHALAVWGFGGQVVQFGYRAFWGYVVPRGNFTFTEDWFISLAGTLASLLFGLGVWLSFRHSPKPILRYFGLRALRFQTFFSLIYYPVFTLLGFEGDWKTIYDFGATPVWSGVTAVAHLALLILFWQGDRRGWFEMPAFADDAAAQTATQLASTASSYDPQTQLRYIESLRRGGAINQAQTALRRLIAQHPDNGLAYLEMAALQSQGKRQIPAAALENARKALGLGLPNHGAAFAHQLLGRYSLEVGRLDDANNHLSQGIALLNGHDESAAANEAHLLHLRSRVYRQQGKDSLAVQDMERAAAAAQRTGHEELVAFYQDELATLTQQVRGERPYSP